MRGPQKAHVHRSPRWASTCQSSARLRFGQLAGELLGIVAHEGLCGLDGREEAAENPAAPVDSHLRQQLAARSVPHLDGGAEVRTPHPEADQEARRDVPLLMAGDRPAQ